MWFFIIIIVFFVAVAALSGRGDKKNKETKTKTGEEIEEVINFIYFFTLSEAAKAATDIIKSEFFKNKDRDSEEKKLQFDLCFPFLVVVADCVHRATGLSIDTRKNIMDSVCNLYFNSLEKFNQPENNVNARLFIKNKSERSFFLKQNPFPNSKIDVDEFNFKTSLYTIATTLFNKRFLEYKELYKSDLQDDSKQPPLKMVFKFYENWSGEKGYPGAMASEFLLELFTRIASFDGALSKYLHESF